MGWFICLFPSGSCWSTEAYPGRFAGLLADDQQVVCDTLAHMASMWRTWQEAHDVQDKLVQDWRREGYVEWPFNYYIFGLCSAESFLEVPELVVQILREVFVNSSTKAVEDAFREERVKENTEQASKLLSPQATWLAPIQRQVLNKLHRYQEIEHADLELSANDPRKIPHSLYTPKKANASDPAICTIQSTRQKADWPSYTPQSSLALVARSAVMKDACSCSMWHNVCHHWLSCLLDINMLVRRHGSHDWLMSLGSVRGVAGLALPVQQVSVGTQVYYKIATGLQMQWLSVCDISEWEAALIAWCSPLHMLVKHKGTPASAKLARKGEGLFRITSPAKPLMQTAAANAFHQLGEAAVTQLAGHVGADCNGTFFDKLWQLTKHLLPDASDADLLEIIGKRLQPDQSYSTSFFEDPLVQEAFGEEDGEQLSGHIQEAKLKHVMVEDFTKSFTEKARQQADTRGCAEGRGRGRGRGRSRGRGASSSSGDNPVQQRVAPQLGVHQFSLEDARQWLPPVRCTLSKDLVNGRWLVSTSGLGTRSRSFQLYGERKALAMVLLFSWEVAAPWLGSGCPHQWILDEGVDIAGAD